MLKRRNFPRPFSDHVLIHLFVIFMTTIAIGKIYKVLKFIFWFRWNFDIIIRRTIAIKYVRLLNQTKICSKTCLKILHVSFLSVEKKYSDPKKSFPRHRQKINKKEYRSLGLKLRGSNKYCYVREYVNIFVCTIIVTSGFKQPWQSLLLLLPTCQFRMA